jgi:hypothetical protein
VSGRIIVHSLGEAQAALAAAAALKTPVTLQSAPGAGAALGALWWKALVAAASAAYPGLVVDAVLDCGDEAGSVLAALRAGLTHLRFAGPEAVREKLAAIAAGSGAVVEAAEPVPALDLLDRPDAETLVKAFLQKA